MALAGVELETLVFEPDALTIRPPPCASLICIIFLFGDCSALATFSGKNLLITKFKTILLCVARKTRKTESLVDGIR